MAGPYGLQMPEMHAEMHAEMVSSPHVHTAIKFVSSGISGWGQRDLTVPRGIINKL